MGLGGCVDVSENRSHIPSFGLYRMCSPDLHVIAANLIIIIVLCYEYVRVIKSRRMRWAAHVVRMGKERGVYRVLVGKPEGKRPLGRPRRRWVDNIRMDLQEVGCEYMDWIGRAQDIEIGGGRL